MGRNIFMMQSSVLFVVNQITVPVLFPKGKFYQISLMPDAVASSISVIKCEVLFVIPVGSSAATLLGLHDLNLPSPVLNFTQMCCCLALEMSHSRFV